jgi:hypothetical protein
VFRGEAANINCIVFDVIRPGPETTIYFTRGAPTITPMLFQLLWNYWSTTVFMVKKGIQFFLNPDKMFQIVIVSCLTSIGKCKNGWDLWCITPGYIQWHDCLLLYLKWYSYLGHQNNSLWIDMSLYLTHYPYWVNQFYSLKLCVQRRSSKYQLYCFWRDPTRAWNHNDFTFNNVIVFFCYE